MSHTESSLIRLNKEDLVRMLLDYQGKFNNILDELKNDLNELKTKFCKFESDLHISRNVNDKLIDKLVFLERNVMLMNSTPEENVSKYWVFLLKWEIKTLKKGTGGFGCNRRPS